MSIITQTKRSQHSRARTRAAWQFISPMILVLLAVAAWPLWRTIWFGFTDATLDDIFFDYNFIWFGQYLDYIDYGDGDGEWIGLLIDGAWWNAVYNTLLFAVISVSIETALGVIVALIIHSQFAGRGLVRATILIPWAIPTVVSAQMWKWMLHDQLGIINDGMLRLGLIAEPIAWTAQGDTAFIAVILVDVWKTTPFMALLILAGMQQIPRDIYEATKIDGVHPVRVFFHVTWPLLRPAVIVAVVFRSLDALRIFDLIYILTPSNEQTITMSVFARQQQFDFNNFSYGSAASSMLFLIIAFITICYLRVSRFDVDNR